MYEKVTLMKQEKYKKQQNQIFNCSYVKRRVRRHKNVPQGRKIRKKDRQELDFVVFHSNVVCANTVDIHEIARTLFKFCLKRLCPPRNDVDIQVVGTFGCFTVG